MMEVTVKNLQKKIPLNLPQINKIVKLILAEENVVTANLSVAFVTRQKIASLNKKYLKKTYSTDVLAFDLTDDRVSYKGQKRVKRIIGEIIISTDAVLLNAKRFKSSLTQELVLYVIHGILHLLGYGDHSQEDIKRMRKKENKILSVLLQKTNYVVCLK